MVYKQCFPFFFTMLSLKRACKHIPCLEKNDSTLNENYRSQVFVPFAKSWSFNILFISIIYRIYFCFKSGQLYTVPINPNIDICLKFLWTIEENYDLQDFSMS